MAKVLIIGADTAIGAALRNALSKEGFTLNLLVSKEVAAGNDKVVVGKADNQLNLKRAMQGVDIVINTLIDNSILRATNTKVYKAILQELGQDKRKLIVMLSKLNLTGLSKLLAMTIKRGAYRDLKQANDTLVSSGNPYLVFELNNAAVDKIASEIAAVLSADATWNKTIQL